MTFNELQDLVLQIDPDCDGVPGYWIMNVEQTQVQVICAPDFDRMRLVVAIRKVEGMDEEELQRLLQANFDSSLDARYAIAQGTLWSVYIHPLSPLEKQQFFSALSQTLSTAKTYGTSYSSGLYTFGPGDSSDLVEQEYIEELKKNDRLN